jgi:hypothetical protein
MNETERRIIQIFNSYKKNQILSRKRKIKALFKKRLAKKKFFKIKKGDEKKSDDESALKSTKSKESGKTLNIAPLQNEQTNFTTNNDHDTGSFHCFCTKLDEISAMNRDFFTKFLDFNYEYENTINLFNSFLCQNVEVSKTFENLHFSLKKINFFFSIEIEGNNFYNYN